MLAAPDLTDASSETQTHNYHAIRLAIYVTVTDDRQPKDRYSTVSFYGRKWARITIGTPLSTMMQIALTQGGWRDTRTSPGWPQRRPSRPRGRAQLTPCRH